MFNKKFKYIFILFISVVFAFAITATAQSNNFEFYNTNAHKYYKSGNFAKAAECFEQMKKWIPNDPNIYYNSAIAYKNSGNPDKALLNINKAISLDSKNAEYYQILYYLYSNKCLFDKAYTTIEKAYKITPGNKEIKFNYAAASATLARDFYSINNLVQAEKYFKNAINLGDNTDSLHNIAQIFMSAKQYQRADIAYNKLLTITPNDNIAQNNKKFISSYLNNELARSAINDKINNAETTFDFPNKIYGLVVFKNTFFPETRDKFYKMLNMIWNDEKGRILLERIVQKKIKIYVSGYTAKSNVYNSQQQYTYYVYGIIPVKFNANKVIEINLEEKCVQLFFNNDAEIYLRIHALSTLIHEFGHAVAASTSSKLDNSIEEEVGVSMIGANISSRIIYGRDLTYDEVFEQSPNVLYSLLLDEHRELPLYNNFYEKLSKFETVIPPNSYIYRDLPAVYARMKAMPSVNASHPELEKTY